MTGINFSSMRRMMRDMDRIEWRILREKEHANGMKAEIALGPKRRWHISHIEESAVRMCDLDAAYAEVTERLGEMRKELAPLIWSLENANDRAVMRLRYIQGYKPEDISDAIYLTERMIYYILSRAERQLARMYPDKIRTFP